ncbi:hypothetical protein [Streptomyces sp. MC1]|uniref:hypothetical protein n=1 Tax=Streptomyces sp. MC1 TaxID=295105 RepID=UPI001E504363|nr:hypothetical protein [Streptomyces sp. MC1]
MAPEVASVGLTTREAARAGRRVEVVDHDIGLVAGARQYAEGHRGTARMLLRRETGVVLWVALVGPGVGEPPYSAVVAVTAEVTVDRPFRRSARSGSNRPGRTVTGATRKPVSAGLPGCRAFWPAGAVRGGLIAYGRPGPLPSSAERPRPSAVTVVLRSRTTVTGVSPVEAGEVLSWRAAERGPWPTRRPGPAW